MGIVVHRKLLRVSIFLFVLSGYIYAALGQTQERIVFGLAAGIMLIGAKKIKTDRCLDRNLENSLYYAFLSVLAVESIVFLSLNCLVYAGAMFLAYLLCDALGRAENTAVYDMVYKESLLISYVIIIISVLFEGVSFQSYKGVFENPNTMGIFAATTVTVLIAKAFNEFFQKKRVGRFEIVSIAVFVFITVVSSCRTAFVAVIAEMILAAGVWLKEKGRVRSKLQNALLKILFISVAGAIVLFQTGIGEIISTAVFSKFEHVIMQGDITNGRLEMWAIVWEESGLLGNGKLIYSEKTVHNVYFGLINQFGKVSGLVFFAFAGAVFVKAWRVAIRKTSCRWRILPLMSVALFFCVSMMENYLMTSPMILMFLAMPLIKGDNEVFRENMQL